MLSTILMTALNAVLPIVLMIALGYVLHQKGILGSEFLKNGNKLVFRFGLPAMLFVNVYSIESLLDIRWDIVLYCAGAVLLIFLLGILLAVMTTSVQERRGVILQCTFRSNFAIIGLSLAATLGGAEAEATAAILSAVTIPLFNVLAVIALSMFRREGRTVNVRRIMQDIVKNPLIQGVVASIMALAIRWVQTEAFGEVVFSLNRDTKFLYTVLTWLKALTTPLALLVLGGQFTFSAVKSLRREIIVATASRLLLAPAIGILGAYLLDYWGVICCGSSDYPALIALFASPVAVASAIMASQMDNDEQLATQLVVWTTLLSGVSIFGISCLLMALGLIAA